MPVLERGEIQITYELYSYHDNWPTLCVCGEGFTSRESVSIIQVGQIYLLFHLPCLAQFKALIVAFLEESTVILPVIGRKLSN